ncbi:MAG: RT0821/Lpp0805 family surface protein [Gammaproteobacteria bacterium]|nr:RT0821/Lpp0805 family surface protein [Gammaproteobacteria bacterium]
MNKITIALAAGALTLSVAGCQNPPEKQQTGAVIGGVLGGVLGSQVGEGKGKTAAIIAGTLVGAVIGGEIGRYMDQTDQLKAQQTLENNKNNQVASWHNPDTGRDVSVTPTRTYKSAGQDCREYTTAVTIDGKKQTAYGTACRQADGTWQVVN